MGNASCRQVCRSNTRERDSIKRVKRDYSSETPNNNKAEVDQGTDSKVHHKSQLGEASPYQGNQSKFKTNHNEKDDAEVEASDVSEGKGNQISECMGEYNFLSGKGIIKKPSRKIVNTYDSGKSTQAAENSTKNLQNSKKSRKRPETESISKSVSVSSEEESYRGGKGAISANEIIQMLKTCDKSKTKECLAKLRNHLYALKSALMTPIHEFVDKYPKNKVEMSTYLNYSPTDELYGLFLVVKNKNLKLLEFLWEECGTLWSAAHFVPLVRKLVNERWTKGISKVLLSERAQEIFVSLDFYEKKLMFEALDDICSGLSGKNDEESKKLLR